MIRLTCTVLALTITATVAAQFGTPTPPKKQLQKFEPMLGTWEGEGTARMESGGEAMKWTATMECKKILDGFFVQQDIAINVGMPMPIAFRTVFGYDTSAKKYRAYGFGNSGSGYHNEIDWIDGKFCIMGRVVEDGQPMIERGSMTFAGDTAHQVSERGIGLGDFYAMVEGKWKRTDAVGESQDEVPAMLGTEVADEMSALDKLCGEWRISAKMVPMPGMDPVDIGGTETMKKMYGGHVLKSHVIGDEMMGMTYQGLSYMVWNKANNCYDSFMLDNMGVMMHAEGRMMGKQLVTTSSHMAMNMPRLQRWIIEMGDDGPKSVKAHTTIGAMDPFLEFDGKYTRAGSR